jgi:UDP-glucose 4-epimerase
VFRRRPPLRLAASPHAAGQARDLRFRSVVWPELDRRQLTTLPAGILATAHDLARHIRAGELVRS